MTNVSTSILDISKHEDAERWMCVLKKSSRIYVQQSADWGKVITPVNRETPLFIIASVSGEDVAGLPLYCFETPFGAVLNSVSQAGALGGVFFADNLTQSEIDLVYMAILTEAETITRSIGALSLTIISNPIWPDVEVYREFMKPTFELKNFTQIALVSDAVQDGRFILPNNNQRNPGRTIRKAENEGVTAVVTVSGSEIEDWLRIHQKRHSELGIKPIDNGMLTRAMKSLNNPQGSFLVVAKYEQQVCGGCLFIHNANVCDAYMLSMDNSFSAMAPNYIIMREAFLEMAQREIKYFNWQSSPSRHSGVYKFKKQWGSKEMGYSFFTKLFVDLSVFLEAGRGEIQKLYPGQFVVPFDVFDQPTRRIFEKE